MSVLNVSNVSATSNLLVIEDNVIVNNVPLDSEITFGAININATTISVGNSYINSSTIAVPAVMVSGALFGPAYGGIVNTQIFTANGTWTNPKDDSNNPNQSKFTGNEDVFIMVWGAGGSGYTTMNDAGGGGGSCMIQTVKLSTCNTTGPVLVGNPVDASNGEASSISTNSSFSVKAYGGYNGQSGLGGSGGGIYPDGGPLWGSTANRNSIFGGAAGGNSTSTAGFTSIFGGGSGAYSGAGGMSVFGGGGGSVDSSAGGISICGGAGGYNATGTSPIVSPEAPGGGGGSNNSAYGDGARGEVRVWVINGKLPIPH